MGVSKPGPGSPSPPTVGSAGDDRLASTTARGSPSAGSHEVLQVALAKIDASDERFQFRQSCTSSDLRKSLQVNGQLTPVQLWRVAPPYTLIDGFRRVDAARQLGWSHVDATLHGHLDERQAFCLAFLENSKRRSLSSWDKASATRRARESQGMSTQDISSAFALSLRQVQRYLELMAFPEAVQEAVRDGRISFSHALVLQRHSRHDPSPWLAVISKEKLSAARLGKRMTSGRASRPRRYIARTEDGFRMFAFRFHADSPPNERERLERVLKEALAIVRGHDNGKG